MIIFDENTKSFLINGNNFSYAMYINGAGFLQTLHFGGAIEADDIHYLIKNTGETVAPDPLNRNFEMGTDDMPSEYGSYARGDFRDPTLIFSRENGASVCRLKYKSHKISKGAPEIAGMPHARNGRETLSIILKDDFSDLEAELNYTLSECGNAVVRNAVIRNTGKTGIALKKAFSFCTDLPCANYSVMRLAGRWAAERTPEVTELGYGITRLQSLHGASSHHMNPFMCVLKDDCNENAGECYGFQLVYSGNFALTAEKTHRKTVRIQGGINDVDFVWQLEPGKNFVTPQSVLVYSGEGLGGLSRKFADFIRGSIVNPEKVYAPRPILLNNWEATYFDFDNEKLFPIIDSAAELGMDTFVLDDGWFGKRNSDNSSLGDWFVNEDKLKGGLKTVIDHCKEKGLKFGLWFEPEMISPDSDLYRAHPDWAIKVPGAEPVQGRNQLILDFSRKEIVEYIFNIISKVLTENDISYVKWDFNRNMTEYFSLSLPAERQGEFAHRYMLGVYDLAERLTSSFPQILFEGCAGGGGRFDAGMLYYFPQIWTSDDTDAFERTKIQWGTSLCYPVSAMSCHVSACPNHQTQRFTPFATRGVVASLGATGYELNLSKLSDEDKKLTVEQVKAYKRIAHLVLKGDLYRLLSPFNSNYFCQMLVSKDKKEAYVAGERIHGVPCDYNIIVYLNGLDDDKIYRIEELSLTASGKALKNAGIILPKLPDYGSWTWHICEA